MKNFSFPLLRTNRVNFEHIEISKLLFYGFRLVLESNKTILSISSFKVSFLSFNVADLKMTFSTCLAFDHICTGRFVGDIYHLLSSPSSSLPVSLTWPSIPCNIRLGMLSV